MHYHPTTSPVRRIRYSVNIPTEFKESRRTTSFNTPLHDFFCWSNHAFFLFPILVSVLETNESRDVWIMSFFHIVLCGLAFLISVPVALQSMCGNYSFAIIIAQVIFTFSGCKLIVFFLSFFFYIKWFTQLTNGKIHKRTKVKAKSY